MISPRPGELIIRTVFGSLHAGFPPDDQLARAEFGSAGRDRRHGAGFVPDDQFS
jgi:hypothetical protein